MSLQVLHECMPEEQHILSQPGTSLLQGISYCIWAWNFNLCLMYLNPFWFLDFFSRKPVTNPDMKK